MLLNRIAKEGSYAKGVIPTAIPVPVIPQVNTIGALSDTDKIFVGAGLVGLSMFLIKGKTFGAINKKKLLVPGLILAAGVGYYGYTKGWFGKNSIPAGAPIKVDPATLTDFFAKVAAHSGAWASGSGIYADVLTTGLPDYAAIINSMSYEEQANLYSLVNDNVQGFSSSAAQYPVLIAMLSKYDLPFIVAA